MRRHSLLRSKPGFDKPWRGLVAVVFAAACGGPPDTGGSRQVAGAATEIGSGRRVAMNRQTPATYAGRDACVRCHADEAARWQGSHHDLAMQRATEETVLGDFDDATFTHFGVTSTFFRRDGEFWVSTDGPHGELREYEIAYTFGVVPLQQYLIEFPGGRYQALSLCWDSRPENEGGQRWFHLYPEEKISYDDPLHWTGPDQNWNYMCAECHSTNLRKNYDLASDSFETTWFEIDVSCEACHGPGSRHVTWAAGGKTGDDGLQVQLGEPDDVDWVYDPETGIAHRSRPRESRQQVETCARCHSRRSLIREDDPRGQSLMDTHRLSLLEERLYHADGQILDEVYVYGSFLQSKMYGAGVTCTDCHDPHSQQLRAEGNAVCARCHLPGKFDTPDHHHHEPASAGASCVECHAPERHYMVVDPRRDHSFRIPRPDLSVKIGTPDACTGCHTDATARWAAETVAGWLGPDQRLDPHYGEALHAGREGLPEAGASLTRMIEDENLPGIARATALSLLAAHAGPGTLQTLSGALRDGDPLVRAAASHAFESIDPRQRLTPLHSLLDDPVLEVRMACVRSLAAIPAGLTTAEQRKRLDAVLEEYRQVQLATAERPESHLNLGWLFTQRGQAIEAERAYRTALRLDPEFVPALVNLSDLYRSLGRDAEGEHLLRRGLAIAPDDGSIHHALGLLLARQGRLAEALDELARAVDLSPDEPRYAYVYGVALNDTGRPERALSVLEAAHQRHPGDRDLLFALASISRDRGDLTAAIEHARKLVAISPGDPGPLQFLARLQAQADRGANLP